MDGPGMRAHGGMIVSSQAPLGQERRMNARATLQSAESTNRRTILIRAVGPCNMSSCPALKDYIRGFKKPEMGDIYIDLSGAESIDSTFTGLLLSVATKKFDAQAPDLHLVSPAERVREAIRSMHLGRFFDVQDQLPACDGEWRDIQIDPPEGAPLAETVVECHKEIIRADDRNRDEFGRVVEGFEAELKKSKSAPDDGKASDQ